MKSICFIHQREVKSVSEKNMFLLLCDVIRDLYSDSARTQEPIKLLHLYELLCKIGKTRNCTTIPGKEQREVFERLISVLFQTDQPPQALH